MILRDVSLRPHQSKPAHYILHSETYVCTPIVDRKNFPEDVLTAPTLKLFQSLLVVTSCMALI